jgi:2-aminobenzoate-CoA ligase
MSIGFARDNLRPRTSGRQFSFTLPELQYPERLNCVTEFVDRWVAAAKAIGSRSSRRPETLTYAQLAERINRIANVLTRDLGMVPGNRVLMRSPNSPMGIAVHLAVIKAGGVMVATMPLLRAKELSYVVTKAKIALALCDARLADEMEKTRPLAPELSRIVYWGNSELETLMAKPGYATFTAHDTASDDVCLIAFTSGTTGEPKGTMHFQRDMLASCDSYAKYVLEPQRDDRFIGSAPLAFTFGLGGHVLFPFRIGAATIQLEAAPPDALLPAIAKYRATVCFTAPTAYRAMLGKLAGHDISSLRKCVSAGETLPQATFDAWREATGMKILDGIGATEMMHIFIGSPEREVRAGATGKVVPGYDAKVVDAEGRDVAPGTSGYLAVRGPTGCRYLADARQKKYVQNGWNVTGDTYVMDGEGYFWYQARSDDMIISAGLQHRGAGSGIRAADASGSRRMRRGRRRRRGARADREGLCGAARGTQWRCRDDAHAAGLRQGDDRAVQVSARDRLCRRPAEDADRQAAALRIAPRRGRAGRAQACFLGPTSWLRPKLRSHPFQPTTTCRAHCCRKAGRARPVTPTA